MGAESFESKGIGGVEREGALHENAGLVLTVEESGVRDVALVDGTDGRNGFVKEKTEEIDVVSCEIEQDAAARVGSELPIGLMGTSGGEGGAEDRRRANAASTELIAKGNDRGVEAEVETDSVDEVRL